MNNENINSVEFENKINEFKIHAEHSDDSKVSNVTGKINEKRIHENENSPVTNKIPKINNEERKNDEIIKEVLDDNVSSKNTYEGDENEQDVIMKSEITSDEVMPEKQEESMKLETIKEEALKKNLDDLIKPNTYNKEGRNEEVMTTNSEYSFELKINEQNINNISKTSHVEVMTENQVNNMKIVSTKNKSVHEGKLNENDPSTSMKAMTTNEDVIKGYEHDVIMKKKDGNNEEIIKKIEQDIIKSQITNLEVMSEEDNNLKSETTAEKLMAENQVDSRILEYTNNKSIYEEIINEYNPDATNNEETSNEEIIKGYVRDVITKEKAANSEVMSEDNLKSKTTNKENTEIKYQELDHEHEEEFNDDEKNELDNADKYIDDGELNLEPNKTFECGEFVVLKTDLFSKDKPYIWKIDGKTMIQKYIPFIRKNNVFYKSTLHYSRWNANIQKKFLYAPVSFILKSSKKHVVKFYNDKAKDYFEAQETAQKLKEDELVYGNEETKKET